MNILVCGRIKEGKSVKAIELAWQHSEGVIVWDPRHMFRGIVLEGDSEMSIGDELETAIMDGQYHDGPLVLWPDGGRLEEDFHEICEVLFSPPERFSGDGQSRGGFAFVVDEAADLQKSQSIDDALRIVVKQHPRTVNVIQCTHSLQEWNRASKDTMSALYCFRLQGRSLTAAVEYADVEDEEELRETIRELGPHAYVLVDFEAQRGAPVWKKCFPLDKHVVDDIISGRIPHVAEEYSDAKDESGREKLDGRGRATDRDRAGDCTPEEARRIRREASSRL